MSKCNFGILMQYSSDQSNVKIQCSILHTPQIYLVSTYNIHWNIYYDKQWAFGVWNLKNTHILIAVKEKKNK